MQTSDKQTSLFGEEESTSSQEASPANRTPLPEKEKAQQTLATSGQKCLEQYERFNQPTSWQKTFLVSLIGAKEWYSTKCTLTWKMKATKYNQFLFQLAASTHRTKEKEYGLLPTIKTQGLKVCKLGKTRYIDLNLLPTPRAATNNGMGYAKNSKKGRLEDRIPYLIENALLPTPQAADGFKTTSNSRQRNLNMLAPIGKTSQLNPQFVAEMMGFPSDHTTKPFMKQMTWIEIT